MSNEPLDISRHLEAGQLAARFREGFALHQKGQLAQALAIYGRILELQPRHFDALHLSGVIAYQTGNPGLAVELIGKAIEINPDNPLAYSNRGNALRDLKQPRSAIESYDRAIALRPDYAEAFYNRGNALRDLKQLQSAIESYDRAIMLKPGFAEAHNNRGNALQDLKRHLTAVESYDRAIALKPDYADAYNNRANSLRNLKQPQAALASYDRAIALKPDFADVLYNRGNALHDLKQPLAALESYDRAITLKPDYAEAYNNRGNALQELQQPRAAIESYDRAIALRPDYAEAYTNRGNTLQELKQHRSAVESYSRAIALNPDYEFLSGTLLHARMHICDWSNAESQAAALFERIERGEKASLPFPVLALTADGVLQRKAARTWVDTKHPALFQLPPIGKRARHRKIRIGYYSADYHNHATAYLMAELFEKHDKDRFECLAFSFGADDRQEMRKRISAAFDAFHDVRDRPDRDIALLSRKLEIDIAVDLKGFAGDGQRDVFAHRPAPIQVSYLGYPGTMAAEYIDYLIADGTVIPVESRHCYSEKIAYLPNSYQVNDSTKHISERNFTRQELGLPPTGFVFCCFNNNYKITPVTFEGWMRILRQVDGSVLWLLGDNPTAADNLRKEAIDRGIDGNRLVFAERMSLAEHLARHRQADLFVDTLPYNAHTTASDALWAGLPVLTCTAEAFASRVAASLLKAVGLPELITTSQQEYEALAIGLAADPARLASIRQRLARNRLTAPLFDTGLFARHIEDAYSRMYERYQAGLLPDHIYAT